ncbi:MAG TPA: hypothetical protein DCS93_00680 [Microscillaceae bacterium]|nr:hypothetical protein [Microscillaceae bacterium]
MKFINNLLYFFANVDPKVIKDFPRSIKVTPQIIGISILLAGIFSTISVGYFLSEVFHRSSWRTLIIIVGSILYFGMIVTTDRGLFLSQNKVTVIVRGLIVLILAMMTSIPFKLSLMDTRIEAEMINAHRTKKANDYNEKVGRLKAEYEAKQKEIDRLLRKLKRENLRLKRLRAAEEDGYKLNSKSTGNKGKGWEWDKYNKQVIILEKRIQELEDEKEERTNVYNVEKSLAETEFENTVATLDQSFISKFVTFKKMLRADDDDERNAYKEFNVGILLIFIMIELLPVFLKVFLSNKSNVYEEYKQNTIALERECFLTKSKCMRILVNYQKSRIADPGKITGEDIEQVIIELDQLVHKARQNHKLKLTTTQN